ncbi:MAG: hypothetical protein WCP15_02745 [bacterium]
MPTQKTKTKSAVEEIMEKSGNGFHVRVVNLLRDLKWTVLVSPYYSDNFTDKPREIDIVAEQAYDTYDFSDWVGSVNARLFIECKYINGDTIFWFDNRDKERSVERIMTDTGMDDPNRDIGVQGHHYFSDAPVAKLFSSEKSRGEDNELMSKAINQNLNALIYYRDRSDLIPNNPHKRTNVLSRVSYPLIVVNSFEHFFKTDMADTSGKFEPITEPFQLEVNYAYIDKTKTGKNEYFLIDVVSIDKLSEFLSMIEKKDVTAVRGNVAWKERMHRAEQQTRQSRGNNSSR